MDISTCKNKGFSLAEIMLALVIIAILMAASAPLVNKRANIDNNFSCQWQDKGMLNGQIYYNDNGTGSIGIGTGKNLEDSILTLKSNSVEKNKITFVSSSNSYSIGIANKSLFLGVDSVASATNSVIIGGMPTGYSFEDGTLSVAALDMPKIPLIYGNFNIPSLTLNGNVEINNPSSTYSFIVNSAAKFEKNLQVGSNVYIDSSSGQGKFSSLEISGAANIGSVNANITSNSILYQNLELASYIDDKISNFSSQLSDARLKNIMGDALYGLDELRKIEIKEYKFKDEKKYGDNIRYGVIAQEIQKIIPNVVKKNKDGYLTICANDIFFISLNAIKQLDKEVEEIKEYLKCDKCKNSECNYIKENEYLRKENIKLTSQIKSLNQRMLELEEKVEHIVESNDKVK